MNYLYTEKERKASHSSCYLEFQKGEYKGKHWLSDSVSLHDDIFHELHLYKLFVQAIPEFDHYGITEVNQSQWEILRELSIQQGGETQVLIEELAIWVLECFKSEKIFTICGI